MKRLFYIAVLFVQVSACSKPDEAGVEVLEEDKGCITRYRLPAHGIKDADTAVVNALFRNNGIDNSAFWYYQYMHGSLQTLYPPYTKYDEKVVKAFEFVKGLRVFTGGVSCIFLNDKFSVTSGRRTKGTSLDTIPALTLGQVRKLFLNAVEQYDKGSALYKDSCIKAELGYYNITLSDSVEHLVKAWRVSPRGYRFGGDFPEAFFQDSGGKLITYFNGSIKD